MTARNWPMATAVWAATIVAVPVAASLIVPLTLGVLTVVRQKIVKNEDEDDTGHDDASSVANSNTPTRTRTTRTSRSTLLTGRVWHTRFHPKKHAFTYPLFIFGVDLDEEETLNQRLWPLSLIMHFSTRHHLLNGEGGGEGSSRPTKKPLRERIYNLVDERTSGGFQPSAETHDVWLVTHLSYYGYVFNPVSFYYLFDRSTGRTDAIVAEVSNTPWIEMYPYVLHPASSDQVECIVKGDGGGGGDNDGDNVDNVTTRTNYIFPKTFHVSPFMEMSYTYDWVFEGENRIDEKEAPWMRIKTDMVRKDAENDESSKQFTATVRVAKAGLHPVALAWQLARYPSYCLIIQFWIHYEAFWLFWKGVAYQPHPTGAETSASLIIGAVMTPFFELQAWLSSKKKKESL